jgi:hypothetical protein
MANMTDEMTPSQAHADLARAAESAQRLHARAGWMPRFLAVFSVGFGVMTAVVGLTEPRALLFVLPIWFVIVAVMIAWTFRQRATVRGAGTRMMLPWVATFALYSVAVAALPRGNALVWAAAAVTVAAPLAVAAVLERRR